MANNVHLVGKHFIQKSKKNLTGKAEKKIKNYVFVLRVTYLFGYILLVVVRNKFVFFFVKLQGVLFNIETTQCPLNFRSCFNIVKVVSGKQKLIFHQSLYFQKKKNILLIELKTKSSEI